MKEIGSKIKEIRKRKGLSQEELAEAASVNLRTIQRIENNESEPRGKTMQLICSVLEVNAEDLYDYGKEEDHNYIVFMHLSVISFLFFPLGNIIIPTILWLNKKDKISRLKETGANLLNFQIIWTVFTFISVVLFAFFKIMHWAGGNFLFSLWMLLYLINIVLPVIFSIKAKKGKYLNYPMPFKMIK